MNLDGLEVHDWSEVESHVIDTGTARGGNTAHETELEL